MPRYLKVILWICLGFIAVLIVAVALLATLSWNYARPWVNKQATELAGRSVQIQGDLDVHWTRPGQQMEGWRGWMPWPRIIANDLVVGNPSWSSQDHDMARVSRLAVTINPIALLSHTVQIPDLDIDTADIHLERDQDGASNWTLKKDPASKPSDWKVDLESISLKSVKAQVVDAASKLDLQTQLDTLANKENGYGLGWKAAGTYNGERIDGEGRTGGILSLQQGSDPFPVAGKLSIGKTSVELEGSVTRPQALAALDVKMKLSGDSMSDMLSLIGVALPVTPPYSTQGRLVATLDGDVDVWRYEDFEGEVGKSDLRGTLEFKRSKPRPILSGTVKSRQLRLEDLGPLVGANTSSVQSDAIKKQTESQPADKVLPASRIHTDSWGVMDADVHFVGEKILRDKDLPLDHIEAQVKLSNKVLALTPLNFGVAGGTLSNTIKLDGSGEQIQATLATTARHLQLKKLFPGAESMKASFGEMHGDAQLSGSGNSIAQILGSSNGEIKAVVSRGSISHFLLEAAGLNLANVVILKLFGDEQIILNCMASDFSVKNGLMTAQTVRLETDDTIVDVTGQINLKTEAIDLKIRPENKTLRIFTLRSPLYAKGTLKNPDVGVEKTPLAARAGAAIALGVVATPFAALLPLLNVGTAEPTDCMSLGSKGPAKKQETKESHSKTKQQQRREAEKNWPSSQAKP